MCGVKEGRHRGLSVTPSSLMGPRLVVFSDPAIEIVLQLLDRGLDLLSERHAVELVEHRLVEALDNAVGLRALVFVRL